jgi:hypothetical protein
MQNELAQTPSPLPATSWPGALRGAGFALMMVLDTTLG